MNPDVRRQLIPRGDVLRLVGVLDGMKAKLLDAAERWQLLDDTGHVPAAPAYADLLQHAADAQSLSADVVRLTADFARSPHSTTRAGRAVLAHLARAATMSSNAAPHFAETAETALSPRPAEATDRHYRDNRMVIDHATARAYLRRASESLRDAATELNDHLELHRFFPEPSRQQSPAPPPGRSARHR
ncbi:hypothetical protein [Streptomyces sp. IB2014 016-6]|uniref:hypothetical protein n=1 Tax=Streptomyces sp. IB2014 016-6 TaxID=2517818 RepID=UPI0011CA8A52|nr:hypothetical protein [Streptomyces sp. IB2014 016-6]TXL84196.1 hypothetical protein EW053_35150 [Streptomyces sp. IB2014 016-6]